MLLGIRYRLQHAVLLLHRWCESKHCQMTENSIETSPDHFALGHVYTGEYVSADASVDTAQQKLEK